jgi:hypothetical protein
MAVQQGFVYESNAYQALKPYGISAGTGPAGASHDRPDLEIKLSTSTASRGEGVELKISPTAAGSLVMKYFNNKWSYGDTGGDPEKELLKSLGIKYKVLDLMNNKRTAWGSATPYLQNDASGKKILAGVTDKRKAYERDIAQYGGQSEVKVPIPAKAICEYYNSKKCSYINVGSHGFYTLNRKDPLGLNKKIGNTIPDFSDSASATIRVRCQYKGGGDYQFVMTLEFKTVKKSPFNLAPITSSNNVAIDERIWKTPENQMLFAAFRKN